MEKTKSKQREVWTDKENKLLGKLVQDKGEKSWSDIAALLNAQCGEKKSGKQCRERYRNYVNPTIEKSEWKPNEKLLFIILHQVCGNQWTTIAKHLNSRSNVAVKNYFYSIIRKATKLIKDKIVPLSCIRKPEKFYLIYSVLNSIKMSYLPDVGNMNKLSKSSCKERIVLSIVNERKLTVETVERYQDQMIEDFRKAHNGGELPVTISVSLNEFIFSDSRAKDLIDIHNQYNVKPLNSIVKVILSQEKAKTEYISNSTIDGNLICDSKYCLAPPEYIPVAYPNAMSLYPITIPQPSTLLQAPPYSYGQQEAYWRKINQACVQLMHPYSPSFSSCTQTPFTTAIQSGPTYEPTQEFKPSNKVRLINGGLFKS